MKLEGLASVSDSTTDLLSVYHGHVTSYDSIKENGFLINIPSNPTILQFQLEKTPDF